MHEEKENDEKETGKQISMQVVEEDETEVNKELPEEHEIKQSRKKVVRRRKSKKEKENPLSAAIRLTVETGKVEFGSRKALKEALGENAKVLVVAKGIIPETMESIKYYTSISNVPIIEFPGTSMELGSICGRPFTVSLITVYDVGNSNIMDNVKKGK